MLDAVCIGEMLIDFTPAPQPGGAPLFAQNPGGAPANVACALSRLGHRTAFIGKAGDDSFGRFLRDTLVGCGVDASGFLLSPDYPTALAFVHLGEDGARDFSFYRKGMADVSLAPDEVGASLLARARLIHFGSVSLTQEPSRSATLESVRRAKAGGALVSFDPNLRPALWESLDEARRVIFGALPLADILKVSEEEAAFLTGEADPAKAAALLAGRNGAPLVLVSRGARGCVCFANGSLAEMDGFPVKAIDTTGCGDCFLAGALHCLLAENEPLARPSARWIARMLAFANAMGALAATKSGAIPAIPSLCAVEAFLAARP